VIRVFIADDQLLIRQGIRTLLEMDDGIAIAGEAEDGVQTVERVSELELDVLLLDVRMPKKNGVEVLQELAAAGRLPPTLVLTTFDETHVVLDAIRSGARGFLLKDISFEQLISAIRAVAAGGTIFQPAITDRLLRATAGTGGTPLSAAEQLTTREVEVIRLMAGGFSNKEIAHALGTAEGTVKNHVSNILAKLGVRDRTRAVLKALEARIL
jgi:DNA-binding NarL/FixJ family response regulator